MKNIFDDYKIELTMSARLPIEGDEDEYINPINGEIFYYNQRKEKFELCGRLGCLFVNLEQVFADADSCFEILDAYDSELSEVAMLFNSHWNFETGYLKKSTQKALGITDEHLIFRNENFVYVQRLEIVAKHRGKGVGIHFLRETLVYLAKVLRFDFYAMKPFPLQRENDKPERETRIDKWQKQLALDKFEQNRPKALKKLRELYAELGFTLVKGKHLMVCHSDYFTE